MAVRITQVDAGSAAWKAGIRKGQTLISVNKNNITDVLDYRFYTTDSHLQVLLCNEDKSTVTLHVRKEEYEDLGLEFETYLMDKQMGCKNKCIFCFVDQTPKGMRSSLYFKDDDTRMSFLFGNYTTLTNLSEDDILRIIKLKVSPINISVHTTNPTLRVEMMGNPSAGEKLRFIKMLTDAGIAVNTQLVLCPNVNDGEELRRSLQDLGELLPALQSIAVVPVGLTKHRQKLYPLAPYTKEQARAVVEQVEQIGEQFLARFGQRVAYASDEFYLQAGLEIPEPAFYGGFEQLEDGVGLLASMKQEFAFALEDADPPTQHIHAAIATGTAAYPFLCTLVQQAQQRFVGLNIHVYEIKNDFFGHTVTVAGLVTGTDLVEQLKGKPLGERLLIPSVMLRHEQDRFLDDMTPEQVEQALRVPLQTVENDGYELLEALLHP